MKEYIIKIYHGTISHVSGIDNIVDLAIFIVSFCVVLYCVSILAAACIYFLGEVLDEITR